MKKFIALGFAVVLVIAAALLWQHFNQSKLTGTWVFDFDDNVQSVITVAPNGSYVCHVEGLTNGRVVKLEGTMQIKDGFVIDLCTNDSQTNAAVPRTMRGRIIRMNDHEMVLKWNGMTKDAVSRKVENNSSGPNLLPNRDADFLRLRMQSSKL